GVRGAAACLDRASAAADRSRARASQGPRAVTRGPARVGCPRQARAAAAAPGAGGAPRPHRAARQHPQSTLALGLVQPERSHLSDRGGGDDAGGGEGLRADPRADAPEAHGSFAEILEAGGGGLPGLSGRPPLAEGMRGFEPAGIRLKRWYPASAGPKRDDLKVVPYV